MPSKIMPCIEWSMDICSNPYHCCSVGIPLNRSVLPSATCISSMKYLVTLVILFLVSFFGILDLVPYGKWDLVGIYIGFAQELLTTSFVHPSYCLIQSSAISLFRKQRHNEEIAEDARTFLSGAKVLIFSHACNSCPITCSIFVRYFMNLKFLQITVVRDAPYHEKPSQNLNLNIYI